MAYTPFDDRFAARNPIDNSPAGPGDIPLVTSLLSDASAVPPYWRQAIAADKARAPASVGPAERRDVGQALDRFRNAFFQAWRGYSGLQGQDALDGYSDFSQSLDAARDKVLTGVSGPTRTMVKPLLDDMHLEGLRAGLAHYGQQNSAVNQLRIQLAQANSGTMVDAEGFSFGNRPGSTVGNDDVRIEGETARAPVESSNKPLAGTSGLLTMSQQFKDAIADVESKTKGEYKARNPDVGKGPWLASGRYQLQLPGLQDAGFIDKHHNWTGPAAQRFNVHSENDFRNNPPAQEAAFAAFMAKQAAYLKSDGSLSYIGKQVNGIEAPFTITYDGLLAAAHREGARRVAEYSLFSA